MKVCLIPQLSQLSSNIGGVNRVIHDLAKYLALAGIEIVEDPDVADIIHCHAVAEHPKVDVYTNHGFWVDPPTPWAVHANERMGKMITAAKIVTSPSRWSTDAYRDKFNVQPRVIRNGVDIDKLCKVPKGQALKRLGLDSPYLLFGKNKIQKPEQGEALRQLALDTPNMPMVATVWPEGTIPPNVTVTGLLTYEMMLETIQDCKALISVTKECFSIQVIEALAMGKPVIGWKYGGTAEAVANHVNGYLEYPGGLLHAAMQELRERYHILSLNASAWARELYDLETKIIPQYIQVYEECLDGEKSEWQ